MSRRCVRILALSSASPSNHGCARRLTATTSSSISSSAKRPAKLHSASHFHQAASATLRPTAGASPLSTRSALPLFFSLTRTSPPSNAAH